MTRPTDAFDRPTDTSVGRVCRLMSAFHALRTRRYDASDAFTTCPEHLGRVVTTRSDPNNALERAVRP